MLSFVTALKPPLGAIAPIQENALRSWRALSDDVIALEPPAVRTNEFGTPLLDSMLEIARERARHDLVCLANADIVLAPDLLAAVDRVRARFRRFLLIVRRRNVASTNGRRATVEPPYGGTDVFVFPRGAWGGVPPFAIGRTRWDSWLIYEARRRRLPVVDATRAVCALHPEHGYEHHPQGREGVWHGPEARRNAELLGGDHRLFTALNATHLLTSEGVERQCVRYPPHVLRRLATIEWVGPLAVRLRALWRPLRR